MTPPTSIKWQNSEGKWEVFPFNTIGHMSRDHAIGLFYGPVKVIAKQGETYITNQPEIRDKYKTGGQKCYLFSELERSEKALDIVGFL
jgi:hypothetical protein